MYQHKCFHNSQSQLVTCCILHLKTYPSISDITSITNRGKEFVFRIVSPRQITPIEIAAASREEMLEWVQKIRETAQSANDMVFSTEFSLKNYIVSKVVIF